MSKPEVRRWLEEAREDLERAKVYSDYLDHNCQYVHWALEKALKGLIAVHNIHFSPQLRTRDLLALAVLSGLERKEPRILLFLSNLEKCRLWCFCSIEPDKQERKMFEKAEIEIPEQGPIDAEDLGATPDLLSEATKLAEVIIGWLEKATAENSQVETTTG